MPTPQQDDWIKTVFGLDPGRYQTPDAAAAAPGRSEHDAKLETMRQSWLATRAKIETDITALQGKIAQAYKGHDMAQELEDAFQKRVEPVLGTFDDSLAHKLDAVIKSADAARPQLIIEARAVISAYEKFLDSDDVIGHLDKNPLTPLSIRKTLDAALDDLGKALA